MLIVTTIYCAEEEEAHSSDTGNPSLRTVSDLKDAARVLLMVYKGSTRELPLDEER